ncbi:MAG: hypothetical protein ABR501_14875 [Pyrinomonadaceae bacterium]
MKELDVFHSRCGSRNLLVDSVVPITVTVPVRKTFAEVPAVQFTVTETRIVIFGRVLVVALVAVFEPLTAAPIVAPFLDAVVIAGVQRGLAKLSGVAVVSVTTPVTPSPPSIIVIIPPPPIIPITVSTPLIVVPIVTSSVVISVPAPIAGIVAVDKNVRRLSAPPGLCPARKPTRAAPGRLRAPT